MRRNSVTTNKIDDNVQKPKHSFLLNFLDKDNSKAHKRQDSDSKLSLNFVRGFRRENSDFFPLSKRHSAILGDRQVAAALAAPQRASVIYPKNTKNNGEPILTDFVSREYMDHNKSTASITSNNPISNNNRNNNNRGSFFLGPRREKTESVIMFRNSATRQLLLDQQQVNTINQTIRMKKKHISFLKKKNKFKSQPPLHITTCISLHLSVFQLIASSICCFFFRWTSYIVSIASFNFVNFCFSLFKECSYMLDITDRMPFL